MAPCVLWQAVGMQHGSLHFATLADTGLLGVSLSMTSPAQNCHGVGSTFMRNGLYGICDAEGDRTSMTSSADGHYGVVSDPMGVFCMEFGTPREDQSQRDETAQNQMACGVMIHQGFCKCSGSSLGANGSAQDGEGLWLELQDAHAAPGARAPQPRRPVRAGARHQASALHGGPQRLQLGARCGPSVPVGFLHHDTDRCCRTTAVHISAMTIVCISVDPGDLSWRRAWASVLHVALLDHDITACCD